MSSKEMSKEELEREIEILKLKLEIAELKRELAEKEVRTYKTVVIKDNGDWRDNKPSLPWYGDGVWM